MEELLYLIYGNHPKSKKLHDEAAKIINYIREKNAVSREELSTFLNIDLNSQKGKKHFYNLVSPMFSKILVSEHRGKAVYYHLSYDMFRVYLDSIRRKAKYYLLKNAEVEKDEQESL
ncbi:MAG: hypothetical protein M1348_03370 [Candidatus Parvarchaeota archaeon]|jgi:hypothetical protein|nr:hypothetical protein [Candidatus Parvarchaeota archaeon]MCL5101621.1 hypothetical protein [Candidatus Parvarchaeota archaeon]